MKDYYKILGVQKGASEEEIKKAYYKLAHQHHPDKGGGDGARFKEINEAYQVLSNKDKRASYDHFGTAEPFSGFGGMGGENPFAGFGFGGTGGFEDTGNLGDIFEAFFEGLGVRQKRRAYNRGSDLEVAETVSLEEAFRGLSKKAHIKTYVKCSDCDGYGHDVKAGTKECAMCGGRGEIQESKKTFFGNFAQVRPCPQCFATGKVPNKVCAECRGVGRVDGNREIGINIFPGIRDGQIIKIISMGEAGERNAESGDLYVRVRVRPHSVFRRDGDDLFMTKSLNVVDALLGNKLEISGIDGRNIGVEIPAGFSLKENLRIPGEGMPKLNSGKRGDLYITFDVVMPKKVSAKARQLLEDLRGEI